MALNGFNAQTAIECGWKTVFLLLFRFPHSGWGRGNNVKMNVKKCNEKSIIVCSLQVAFHLPQKWGFVFTSTLRNSYRIHWIKMLFSCFPSLLTLLYQQTKKRMNLYHDKKVVVWCCLMYFFMLIFNIQKVGDDS